MCTPAGSPPRKLPQRTPDPPSPLEPRPLAAAVRQGPLAEAVRQGRLNLQGLQRTVVHPPDIRTMMLAQLWRCHALTPLGGEEALGRTQAPTLFSLPIPTREHPRTQWDDTLIPLSLAHVATAGPQQTQWDYWLGYGQSQADHLHLTPQASAAWVAKLTGESLERLEQADRLCTDNQDLMLQAPLVANAFAALGEVTYYRDLAKRWQLINPPTRIGVWGPPVIFDDDTGHWIRDPQKSTDVPLPREQPSSGPTLSGCLVDNLAL